MAIYARPQGLWELLMWLGEGWAIESIEPEFLSEPTEEWPKPRRETRPDDYVKKYLGE